MARNEGIRRAKSNKLVFFDDDSRPVENYLSQIATILDEKAAVAGKTVHPSDDVFSRRLTGHYDFGDTSRYVNRFWGCNMAVRKEVFDKVGMWDAEIPWGHEEIELAERVLTAYPIYYDPNLIVRHPYADSIVDYWKKMYRIEKMRPYVWQKQGLDKRSQWAEITKNAINPTKYLGWSPTHMLVRGGATIFKTLGRIQGMYSLQNQTRESGSEYIN